MAIWTWIKGGLAHAVLALAAIAFILVPTADAAVCGPEPAAVFSSMGAVDLGDSAAVLPEQAPDRGDGHDGEACMHGHCHHQGQVVSAPIGGVAVAWSEVAETGPSTADRNPPGADQLLLQRPPRV